MGVVHDPGVHQLVQDQVVGDVSWGHDQAPIERDVATGGAIAPFVPLRPDE
jgi:hypothetical protein